MPRPSLPHAHRAQLEGAWPERASRPELAAHHSRALDRQLLARMSHSMSSEDLQASGCFPKHLRLQPAGGPCVVRQLMAAADLAALAWVHMWALAVLLVHWRRRRSWPCSLQAQLAVDMTARTGSLGYMSPEVLQGKAYNEKADVFSFGASEQAPSALAAAAYARPSRNAAPLTSTPLLPVSPLKHTYFCGG